MPRTASSHQILGERREKDTVSEPPEGTKSHRHPDFRLLTSRTIKEYSFESLKKRDRIFKNPADFKFLHMYHSTSFKPVIIHLIAELSMGMFDFSPR